MILKHGNRLNSSGKSQDPDISKIFAMPNSTAPTAILLHPQSSQVCLSLLRKFNNTEFRRAPLACPQLNLLLQRFMMDIVHFRGNLPRKFDQNEVFRNSLTKLAIRTSAIAHHFK